MSKRYIDKDDAIQDLKKWQATNRWDEYSEEHWEQGEDGWNAPVDVIEQLLPADVQEVVRCKNCIHGIPTRIDTVRGEFSDERYCYRHRMCHFEGYYCADGKRKETEDATIHRC